MLSFTKACDRDLTEIGETVILWLLCGDEGESVMVVVLKARIGE